MVFVGYLDDTSMYRFSGWEPWCSFAFLKMAAAIFGGVNSNLRNYFYSDYTNSEKKSGRVCTVLRYGFLRKTSPSWKYVGICADRSGRSSGAWRDWMQSSVSLRSAHRSACLVKLTRALFDLFITNESIFHLAIPTLHPLQSFTFRGGYNPFFSPIRQVQVPRWHANSLVSVELQTPYLMKWRNCEQCRGISVVKNDPCTGTSGGIAEFTSVDKEVFSRCWYVRTGVTATLFTDSVRGSSLIQIYRRGPYAEISDLLVERSGNPCMTLDQLF